MTQKFELTIKLGTPGMESADDIAAALELIAHSLRNYSYTKGNVNDSTKVVGKWSIETVKRSAKK